jgi:Bacterial PH domain
MSVALASFPAAPLDRTARLVTRFVWLLGAGLAIGGVAVLSEPARFAGVMLVVSGVAIAVMAVWLRRREPVSYLIEDDGLVVQRRGSATRRFAGELSEARRGTLGLRVAGDGGLYGYLGRFRADGATVNAFVTNRDDVVLLAVGEERIALSPADPDAFISAAGGGDA